MRLATILGTYFSVIGVIIALYQLSKIRKSADAAKLASMEAYATITKNVFMIDFASISRTIEEIKTLIRAEKHESALLRTNDVIIQLQQASSLPLTQENSRALSLSQTISQLSILRELLEKKQRDPTPIDVVFVNSVLSKIADKFNKIIGQTKYQIKGEQTDAR
jgi:uncharacterized protein with PQ loop repeat